ncbi:DUF1361 domain-containing protein [Danxiaibacter flavus]|uniref:DUF1361 domain-containing protein n=1 Tax=Danxiaibacter flavus TaxID=3049108 RepID=A0ABV3Z868_9BACT|nr:DUF1361 domain-containing protein [Chitinophagaceae bacterium DXS]
MKMRVKLSAAEKMLAICIFFNLALFVARFIYTRELNYGFYIWNTFLAVVPMLFSRRLYKHEKISFSSSMLVAGWLLFFPNAPYLITDLFHFEQRPNVPFWFDLLLVVSGAWNGLILGFISLIQVEQFLAKHVAKKWMKIISAVLILLCGYGVYLGRFLRFNSWNIIDQPFTLIRSSASHVLLPHQHLQAWAFTLSFSALLYIIYVTIKKLPGWSEA